MLMDTDSVSCHFYGTHHMSLIECKVQGKQAPQKKDNRAKLSPKKGKVIAMKKTYAWNTLMYITVRLFIFMILSMLVGWVKLAAFLFFATVISFVVFLLSLFKWVFLG